MALLVKLSGRCSDGAERGRGRVVHLIATTPSTLRIHSLSLRAFCGAKPGRLSGVGWTETDGPITCKRCRARLDASMKRSMRRMERGA